MPAAFFNAKLMTIFLDAFFWRDKRAHQLNGVSAMKKSKRNVNNSAAKVAKKASGKPVVSKYGEKGGPYKYDLSQSRKSWKDR